MEQSSISGRGEPSGEARAVPSTRAIYVACGTSDEYAHHLAVTLHSAIRHIDSSREVHVCIMDGGISQARRDRVRRSLDGAHPRATLHFIRPDVAMLDGLPTTDRYPLPVYFRLLMPFVLPEEVDRVLYLDSDIVVTEDISPLFDMDLGRRPLWAVNDVGGTRGTERLRQAVPEHPMPKGTMYFNGGVMLMNLPAWRRERITEQVVELIRLYGDRFRFFEQDPMNIVMARSRGQLHPRWNNIIQGQERIHPITEDWGGRHGIIHFAGKAHKPWHWGGRCLYENTYYEALIASRWLTPRERVQMELYRAAKAVSARLPLLQRLRHGRLRPT